MNCVRTVGLCQQLRQKDFTNCVSRSIRPLPNERCLVSQIASTYKLLLGYRKWVDRGFGREICCSGKEPLNPKKIVSPLVRQLPWSHHFITQKKAVKKEASSLAHLR